MSCVCGEPDDERTELDIFSQCLSLCGECYVIRGKFDFESKKNGKSSQQWTNLNDNKIELSAPLCLQHSKMFSVRSLDMLLGNEGELSVHCPF